MAGLVPFNRKKSDLTNMGIDDFYNMLDDFFTETWPFRKGFGMNSFKVDVQEDAKNYFVAAELPGVNKDEISITLDEGTLQIAVTRSENTEHEEKNYIHKERRSSSTHRSLYLADADRGDVKAKLENGVLSITIPKKEKTDNAVKVEID